MGLVGSLVGLAFFLIVIGFFVHFFSGFIDDTIRTFESFLNAQANKADNRVGSTVCDLRFRLFGAFDEAGFGFDLETQQRLYLGIPSPSSGGRVFHPEVAQFNFDDCFTQGSASLFNFIPRYTTENLSEIQGTTLALTNITDLTFKINMEFIRVDDKRSIGTKSIVVNQKSLSDLPQTFQSDLFFFNNVELTEYDVEITCSGDCSKINNLASGEPFIYQIRFG